MQQGSEGFHWVESTGTTSKDCLLSLLEPPLHAIISAFSLHSSLEYEITNLTWSDLKCYGPYQNFQHLQRVKETRVKDVQYLKSGEYTSAKRRIVLALASFSGGDETGGNGPSTTDNDETELCMKESIDLSAPH